MRSAYRYLEFFFSSGEDAQVVEVRHSVESHEIQTTGCSRLGFGHPRMDALRSFSSRTPTGNRNRNFIESIGVVPKHDVFRNMVEPTYTQTSQEIEADTDKRTLLERVLNEEFDCLLYTSPSPRDS